MPTWLQDQSVLLSGLIFALGAGSASAAIVALDWLVVFTGSESYLKITHGSRTPKFLVVWFFGGAIVGGLGLGIGLYQENTQAALLVAFTWRTFLQQAQRFLPRHQEETQSAESGAV